MANKKTVSPPERTSSWDLEAFEQQVSGSFSWSAGNHNTNVSGSSSKRKKQTKATRIQDLAIDTLGTPPSSPLQKKKESNESTWPFESSPCRMFGGKNTKKSEEMDTKNEKLFYTNFADRSNHTFISEDEQSGIGQLQKPQKKQRQKPAAEEEDDETSIDDEEGSTIFINDSDDSDDDDLDEFAGDNDVSFRSGEDTDGDIPSQRQRSVKKDEPASKTPPRRKSKGSGDDQDGKSPSARKIKDKKSSKHKDSKQQAASKPERKNSQVKKQERTKMEKSSRHGSTGSSHGGAPSSNSGAVASNSGATTGNNTTSGSIRPSTRKSAGESNRPRNKSTADADPLTLTAASYHSCAKRSARRGLTRAKSSDGMSGMSASVHTWTRRGDKRKGERGGSSNKDELSAASAHASIGVGASGKTRALRRSNSTRMSSSTPSGNNNKLGSLDRRGKLSRAMSATNVRRPEEYAGVHAQPVATSSKPSKSSPSTRDKERSTRSESLETKSRHEKRGKRRNRSNASSASTASGSSRERERVSIQESAPVAVSTNNKAETAEPQQQQQQSAAAATSSAASVSGDEGAAPAQPAVRRKKSQRLGSNGSGRSLKSESKAETKSSSRKSRSSATTTTASENRRDILELFREGKTIQPSDLMDKDNRKLLHFMMYEHRMGVSQKGLVRQIRQEKEST